MCAQNRKNDAVDSFVKMTVGWKQLGGTLKIGIAVIDRFVSGGENHEQD